MCFGRAFFPSKNVFLSFLPTSVHMIGSMAHGYGFLSPSTHGPCFFYIQSTICKLRCYHAILKGWVHLHVSQKLMYGRKTSINSRMVRCNAVYNDRNMSKRYLLKDFILYKLLFTSKRRQVFELSTKSSGIILDGHLVFILL